MRSWISIARCPRISSSRSLSSGRMPVTLLFAGRGIHDPADDVDELRPAVAFGRQLRFARRCQLVVLRLVIGFADAPLGLQPAAFLEAMQRRIERAGLDLQEVVGL